MRHAEKQSSEKWLCTECGYLHTGEAPPDACPVCGAGPEKFEAVEIPTLD